MALLLEIKYVWIDSLCIIQDSIGDWKAEASTMSNVYSHGILNLSATSPHSAIKGLIACRNSDLRPLWIEAQDMTGDLSPFLVCHTPYWKYAIDEAPVNRRGRVLQERVLSRRIVHFTANGLGWECNKHAEVDRATELSFNRGRHDFYDDKHDSGRSLMFNSQSTYTFNKSMFLEEAIETNYTPKYALWRAWRGVVNMYTYCDLTNDLDILIALSGLATSFQSLLNDVYIAGHWRQELECSLTWFANDAMEKRRRASEYRAPSWSWASVRGPVQASSCISPENRRLVKVLNVSITFRDSTHPWGALCPGGGLRLHGSLFRLVSLTMPLSRGSKAQVTLLPISEGRVFTLNFELSIEIDDAETDLGKGGSWFFLPISSYYDMSEGIVLATDEIVERPTPTTVFRRVAWFKSTEGRFLLRVWKTTRIGIAIV